MKKPLRVLIVLSLLFRLLVMMAVMAHPERTFYGEDTLVYDKLAFNLVNRNGFTLHNSPTSPRNITRTPVYPLFIAAAMKCGGTHYIRVMIVLQNALAVLSGILIFLFLKERCGAKGAGIALFIMLSDLVNITCSNFLLTEITYLFISITGFILFVRILETDHRYRYALLAGIAASVAALCRPIHLFFPGLLVAAALGAAWRERRKISGPLAIFVTVYILGISPWLARNYMTHGRAELSHLGVVHSYLYKAGGTIALSQGRDVEEVKQELEVMAMERYGIENIFEDPRSEELARFTRNTIMENPLIFFRSTAIGFAGIALAPDKGRVPWIMGREAPKFNILWKTKKGYSSVMETVKSFELLDISLIVIQAGILVFIYAAIGYGLVRKRYSASNFLVVAACLAIVYYFVLTAGPEGEPRFRIPAMPYVSMLVALSFMGGRGRISGTS